MIGIFGILYSVPIFEFFSWILHDVRSSELQNTDADLSGSREIKGSKSQKFYVSVLEVITNERISVYNSMLVGYVKLCW
jgi:hypothetical protein